jgi:cytochrome c-type biogenesis protein CcmE
MSRRRNAPRLAVAVTLAAILSVFLLYTSIAGGGTPALQPSELAGHAGTVSLAGKVVGPVTGDARGDGLTFRLVDVDADGGGAVAVRYVGSVPDLFEPGRHVFVRGALEGGTFVAEPDTLMTKCPSRYEAEPSG